jgi:hypothetical protein
MTHKEEYPTRYEATETFQSPLGEIKMKRIAWMFLVVLGSVTLMQAQSSTKPMKVSGTICNSACVTKVDNLSTCDKSCNDTSGSAVLVDDQGQVKKIDNPDMCASHMGKHVKMTAMRMGQPAAAAAPTESQREETLRIIDIEKSTP